MIEGDSMRTPRRLQRVPGVLLPPGTAHVGRPSRRANPFDLRWLPSEGLWVFEERPPRRTTLTGVSVSGSPTPFERAVMTTRIYELHHGPDGAHAVDLDDLARSLGGRDLACWCPLADEHGRRWPCHADVLLRWANPDLTFPDDEESW